MNRRSGLLGSMLAALLALAFAPPSRAAELGRVECDKLPSRILEQAVPYCAVLPPGYDTDKSRRYPILYFLHGLGDNEQAFIHTGAWNLVEDLWEQKAMREFIIVTPRGNASFYINSHDGKTRYEDFFWMEFLPGMEHRYRVLPGRSHRGISGISMGGYGALHYAFRKPEMFTVVSAHSAALIEKLPAFTSAGPNPSVRARVLGSVFGLPPDETFWQRNSPLTMAKTAHLAGMNIYFDCGAEDDFGFEAGAAALHKLLESRKIPHEFHIYPGGHDVAYFAEHLPESLQFDAKSFAP